MKQCQICGKRASMFLTQIINGKASELALCEACAKEKGLFDPQSLAFAEKFFPEEFRKRVDKLVAELGLEAEGDTTAAPAKAGKDILTRCPACNFTLEDYRRTGRLGCPGCYQVFSKEIHEGDEAVGEDAATGVEGEESPAILKSRLEEQLRRAIEREDYEEAAKLRDRLRGLD